MGKAGELVSIDRQDGVAVLRLDNPPVNMLSQPLRNALSAALDAVATDAETQAVVLAGAGAHFCYGLDVRDLDQPWAGPHPRDLANRIETLGKPVVAALSGMTTGAGFELALAATARVARGGTQVGLADLGLGLTPGAGGTQRLPRVVGAKPALDMMLSARTGPIEAAPLAPLVHTIVAGDPVPLAVELARKLAKDGNATPTRERTDGFADPAAYQSAVAARQAEVARSPHPAARDIVACVEAAMLLPFEAGIAMEAQVFDDAVASVNSQALRHVFFAERRAGNMPETRPGAARAITQVGVVGGGPSAAGIAGVCLDAGLSVIQFERTDDALASARAHLTGQQGGAETPKARARLAKWTGTTVLGDLAAAPLIIEAVAEVVRTKQQVFAALDKIAGDDTILATQSGLLPIDEIAAATSRPAQVTGLHFHAPIGPARLVEVIPGSSTDADVVASVAELARGRLGRVAVRAGTGGGALSERIMAAARDAGLAMLAEGVPIERIDRVIAEWGVPQGIFRQIDMIGTEVVLTRGRLLVRDAGFPAAHLDALELLVGAGRTGRADGQGLYRWDEGGHAHVAEDLPTLLFGDVPAPLRLEEDDIRMRVIAAMANEGARMLRADLALRPSDIDVACVLGAQFPRWRGGPMKAADLVGLFEVLRTLRRLEGDWPALYAPDPGFAALVKNGEGFEALNKVGKNRRTIPG